MLDNLIPWYRQNKRNLPFRLTKDPYLIWLSEIILQQTRVEQGLAYYQQFATHFPSVADLAHASIDEVMRLWQGLGYYSRARNLHFAANQVITDYNGVFPKTFNELMKLKGVGEYTAAAIASISNKEPIAAIDGNVYRVIARLMAIVTPIDTTNGKNEFRNLANRFLNKKLPGEFNQGMMELGALICKPKNPECARCPLSDNCLAFADKSQLKFPVKEKKQKQKLRYLYLYIIRDANCVFIEQRNKGDIWERLYQFPIIESEESIPEHKIISPKFLNIPEHNQVNVIKISDEIKHVLSHQVLRVKFVHLRIKNNCLALEKKYLKVGVEQLENYALPRLITRYMESNVI